MFESVRGYVLSTSLTVYVHLYIIYFKPLTVDCCNATLLGTSACVRISTYTDQQWSACVTDMYIRQKSKGRHGCLKGQDICVYPCMFEFHDRISGQVTSPCTCSASDGDHGLKTDGGKALKGGKSTALPSWCFTPTGAKCSWFKTCLGQRYSCGDNFKSEVIKFAEALCGLYLNPYSALSENGHIWINGVRKCLQVNLVPLLRNWLGKKCKNLTNHAISLYRHCFFSPYPATVPNICELPLNDLWRIFWHLRQSLSVHNTQRSLLEILNHIQNCTEFKNANLTTGKVRKLVFHVKHLEKLETSRERKFLNKELGGKIAKQFCFDKKGIAWFGYPKIPRTSINNTAEFVFYIADKYEHTMSQKVDSHALINLTETVRFWSKQFAETSYALMFWVKRKIFKP